MKNITLRDCHEEDRAFVWEVRRQALREYVAAIWGWDEQAQHAKFAQKFTPDGHQIIVADGQDVGLLQVVDEGTRLVVGKIELLPQFQRQGIGTVLMTRILADARARKVPVHLQVLRTNTPARRLYERLGFAVSGTTETHVQMEFVVTAGIGRRFFIEGGRAGTIHYNEGERRGHLDWEMLIGEFNMVIYADSARWTAPERRAMTKDEVRALVRELVTETKLRIDLAFSDGSEDIRP